MNCYINSWSTLMIRPFFTFEHKFCILKRKRKKISPTLPQNLIFLYKQCLLVKPTRKPLWPPSENKVQPRGTNRRRSPRVYTRLKGKHQSLVVEFLSCCWLDVIYTRNIASFLYSWPYAELDLNVDFATKIRRLQSLRFNAFVVESKYCVPCLSSC